MSIKNENEMSVECIVICCFFYDIYAYVNLFFL